MPNPDPNPAPKPDKPDLDRAKHDAQRLEATSLATINKLISGIARSAVKLNETIHETGLLCIQHAKSFGDCSSSARLVDAMPKSHRRSLVINWFKAYSPIVVGKDAKTDRMKSHLSGKAEDRVWDLDGAKATPFFAMEEANREPEVPTYLGIHENILAFVKRTETRIKGTDERPGIEDEVERNKALEEVSAIKKAVGVAA